MYLPASLAADLDRRSGVDDNVRVKPGGHVKDTRRIDLKTHP
jgi:hypothetical protein